MPVSLQNLLKIGQIKAHPTEAAEVQKLLAAPARNLADARATSIGLTGARINVLDTLRRQRNLSDYTGEDIDDSSVGHCAAEAGQLLQEVTAWLKANRPHLAP